MINYFTHAFTYKYFSSTMNYHFFKYTQITRKKKHLPEGQNYVSVSDWLF